MISVARSAKPRRGPNRVQLVNLDGTPVRRPKRDHALAWPAWTDSHYWECGESPHDLAAHVTFPEPPEPDAPDGEAGWVQLMIETALPAVRIPGIDPEPEPETDAEFFARLAKDEAIEEARVLATYHPLPEDLDEYRRWSEALDAGTLPPAIARRFTFGCLDESRYSDSELDAIRRGQVSSDELAMLAAHGAI